MSSLYWKRSSNLISWIFAALIAVTFRENVFVNAMYLPTVVWDPRNPLFNCPSRGVNTILVKLGDYMNFMCPVSSSNLGMQESRINHDSLYEIAYFVHPERKQDALTCNATGYSHFLKCDKTTDSWGRAIRIAPATGDTTAPLFNYGKTYYLIGTGNGLKSGIPNQVGGRCNTKSNGPEKTHKMILKIRVCTKEEELVHKNCTMCNTIGCYNKGCGLYKAWSKWQYTQNLSYMEKNGVSSDPVKLVNQAGWKPKCIRRRYRVCDNKMTGCDGPGEETQEVACGKIEVLPAYNNCTPWVVEGNLYRNRNNTETKQCFAKMARNCTIGILERTTVSQRKFEKVSCMSPVRKPLSGSSKGEKSGTVSLSIALFILCMFAAAAPALALGAIIGYSRKQKQRRGAGYRESELLPRKSTC